MLVRYTNLVVIITCQKHHFMTGRCVEDVFLTASHVLNFS